MDNFLDFPKLEWDLSGKDFTIKEYAKFIRKQWDLAEKPISDLSILLEQQGFVLAHYNNHSSKVDAFSGTVNINQSDYYVIMMEGEGYSFYRQQFSLAHELGHWLLHESSESPQSMDALEYRAMEDEANEFAAEFLLPEDAFKNSVGDNVLNLDHYRYLKRFWNVSIAMMIMRAKSLGLMDSQEYTSLQRKLNYRHWRKQEPGDTTKLISEPVALKQGIELLVENNIVNNIQNSIGFEYGLSLHNFMIEDLVNLEPGYLTNSYYDDPKIVELNLERIKRGR